MQKSRADDFLSLAVAQEILKFGDFTLKSGRVSPYFFNAGEFKSGEALAKLGLFYADVIASEFPEAELVFGPAYKGIPLVAVSAAALYQQHQIDLPWAFNRKEAKTHGEGGQLVGAPLAGKKVIVLDDVITAGTAIREVASLIEQAGGILAGVVVALDRAEKGADERSAVQAVEADLGVKVKSIASLNDVVNYLKQAKSDASLIKKIEAYRSAWGV